MILNKLERYFLTTSQSSLFNKKLYKFLFCLMYTIPETKKY